MTEKISGRSQDDNIFYIVIYFYILNLFLRSMHKNDPKYKKKLIIFLKKTQVQPCFQTLIK